MRIPNRVFDALPAGADLEAEPSESGEGLQADVYLPAGRAWVASGGHCLAVHAYSDRRLAWDALLRDMAMGTEPCDNAHCDICEQDF